MDSPPCPDHPRSLRPSRRTLVRGAAWAVPAVTFAGAVPARAVSPVPCVVESAPSVSRGVSAQGATLTLEAQSTGGSVYSVGLDLVAEPWAEWDTADGDPVYRGLGISGRYSDARSLHLDPYTALPGTDAEGRTVRAASVSFVLTPIEGTSIAPEDVVAYGDTEFAVEQRPDGSLVIRTDGPVTLLGETSEIDPWAFSVSELSAVALLDGSDEQLCHGLSGGPTATPTPCVYTDVSTGVTVTGPITAPQGTGPAIVHDFTYGGVTDALTLVATTRGAFGPEVDGDYTITGNRSFSFTWPSEVEPVPEVRLAFASIDHERGIPWPAEDGTYVYFERRTFRLCGDFAAPPVIDGTPDDYVEPDGDCYRVSLAHYSELTMAFPEGATPAYQVTEFEGTVYNADGLLCFPPPRSK